MSMKGQPCLPIESPCYSRKQNYRLDNVLQNKPRPIVLYPAFLEDNREWHAKPSAQDKDHITQREGDGVLREHGRKVKIQWPSICFDASHISPDGEDKNGDPKK